MTPHTSPDTPINTPVSIPLYRTRRVPHAITAAGISALIIGTMWALVLAFPGPTLLAFAFAWLAWLTLEASCDRWATRTEQRRAHGRRAPMSTAAPSAAQPHTRRNGTRP